MNYLATPVILGLLLLGVVALDARPAIRVIDGDTIQYGRSHVRLLGFDAPEVRPNAACPQEHEMGLRAKARLTELLSPPHRATFRWRAGRDKYGRSLAWAYSDHKEVGAVMVAEGLARPYRGRARLPWC